MSETGALPFSNNVAWNEFRGTYRRVERPSDEMISVVHDGTQILMNTSGRHTESKSFELCPKYGLYVPQSKSSSDAPTFVEQMVANLEFRKAIDIDSVKDPQALEDVIKDSLKSFRTFSDIQVSARIRSDYWDHMIPLRDFVLSHNFTGSGYVRRHTNLEPVAQRELPETVLNDATSEEGRHQSYRSSDHGDRRCLIQ